ncbi:DUF4193 family protein [Arthrobacter ruber]|uniref:DUF4193 family protein n=1 Tax=Arthrobacter ruber TaxID=1258893 RepID=UPI001F0C8645|nr:DUF4193 family protein [Arthrobacter ruber]
MAMEHQAQHAAGDDGASRDPGHLRQHGVRRTAPGSGPMTASATALMTPPVDEDEIEAADSFDLPGADLSSEEISVQILAAQADEFTCASCFLVRHRSQIALDRGGKLYCMDCEG